MYHLSDAHISFTTYSDSLKNKFKAYLQIILYQIIVS